MNTVVSDQPSISINIAILTVSDSRTEENDRSGDILVERLMNAGHQLEERAIIKDDTLQITSKFSAWIANPNIDVIISTGGTGVTGRDVTPEALMQVCEKEIPGFGELFRWISFQKIKTSAIQSRAVAGVARGTYIFCIPGSTGACKDAWDEILVHQLDNRFKPCNFVELMPRLREHEL